MIAEMEKHMGKKWELNVVETDTTINCSQLIGHALKKFNPNRRLVYQIDKVTENILPLEKVQP
jgi:hypothetical protein